jgi:hydroxyacyl-ACP dehydratase HTD2-like protein with hotdog domain
VIRTLSLRSVGPLFANVPFTVAGRRDDDRLELWAMNDRNRLAMGAQAELA